MLHLVQLGLAFAWSVFLPVAPQAVKTLLTVKLLVDKHILCQIQMDRNTSVGVFEWEATKIVALVEDEVFRLHHSVTVVTYMRLRLRVDN